MRVGELTEYSKVHFYGCASTYSKTPYFFETRVFAVVEIPASASTYSKIPCFFETRVFAVVESSASASTYSKHTKTPGILRVHL
jgi:hypothetical protein